MGLILEDNAKDDLPIGTNGPFTFVTLVEAGAPYAVTVINQPTSPVETCVVTNGTGTATANVTNIQVTCMTQPTYSIGGSITGLTGTGLVLQNNGGDNLAIAAGQTTFNFATQALMGASYNVTVFTQPSNPVQSCTVTNGGGTASANVTSVQIACVNVPTYSIGGTVSGLTGSGLVLQDNGVDNLPIAPGQALFTFPTPIGSGNPYAVTVLTQPSNPAQICSITNAGGTVATAPVTNVAVTCNSGATFTIGGTISGLTRTGLVLLDNGGDNLTISAGQASFTFATPLPSGGTYNVTVSASGQPSPEFCSVTNGSGNAGANVKNVDVSCAGQWTWESGSDASNQPGVYGIRNHAAPSNVPGARYGSVSWIDSNGNFWLFGGYGYDAAGAPNYLNDLWEYSSGQWIWASGSDSANIAGIYGTEGVASSANIPGSRDYAVTWADTSGNLWLFGGNGYDSAGNLSYLNDLWKYHLASHEWTWVSGSMVGDQSGVYGSEGKSASGNVPGSRAFAAAWIDQSANLWLFGGSGYDSADTLGQLNDLWEYTADGWTWVSGSNLVGQAGFYGTVGEPGKDNVPGARINAASWIDLSGNLWLFGGNGLDATDPPGFLSDLWEYSLGQWTWIGGSNSTGAFGNYGTQGTAAPSNSPGSRQHAVSLTDASGNFWLFGGYGPVPGGHAASAELNDLWKYTGGQWTWVSGSQTASQPGVYGTLGIPDPANVPGARDSSIGWIDASGNFWLFGGTSDEEFNDLWQYAP